MQQFFKKTEFGRELEKISDKTNKVEGGSKVYKVIKKNNLGLSKGDYYYLDYQHGNHIEVYSNGKSKVVVNLDETVNKYKTLKAKNRTINI